MELLYVNEHLTCFNYDGGERPAVESVRFDSAKPCVVEVVEPEIVILLNGGINISFEKVRNGRIAAGEMVVLPPCSRVAITPDSKVDLLVFRLRTNTQFCDRYSLEKLYEETHYDIKEFEDSLNTLKVNEKIGEFAKSLAKSVSEGLKCVYFFDIKIKELFFIFRAYYTKKELAAFFHSLLSKDSNFLYFVNKNYTKAHSAKEFAQLAGYSLSGFDKQFRKVFGMSAYQWIKHKRLKSIYHDINCSFKTLREICEDHNFSSLSQFNDYCKKNFGMPPGKIRRKAGCRALQTCVKDVD